MISKIKLATEALWLHHRRFLACCFELEDFFVLSFLVLTKEIFGEGEFATDLVYGDMVYFHPLT